MSLIVYQQLSTLTVTSPTGTVIFSPPAQTTLTIASVGTQGVPGIAVSTSKTAAAAISAGQVVRPSPSGQLVLALADSTNNAKGAMLAASSAAPSFAAQLAEGFLTLSDWTASTGAASLTPQASYFLSTTIPGGLTQAVPQLSGQAVVFMGVALDASTLQLRKSDPITL